MPKFRTSFDRREIKSTPGNPIKTLYGPIFDSQGRLHLKETGRHDLYAEIQSHADSVDIHVLLQRYAAGDPGALARVQGAYGDFTQMPSTFAEALNTIIAAEQYFNGLPVDVRAKFGHDFNRFIASMDSPTWLSDAGIVPPNSTPDPMLIPPSDPASVPPSPTPTPAPSDPAPAPAP